MSLGELVNLRRVRKARNRIEDEAKAARNRAAFGESGAVKRLQEAQRALHDDRLDGARRAPQVNDD